MALPVKKGWSGEEYLAWERAQTERHELVDGEVVALAGATLRHSLIVGDTVAALLRRLEGGDCSVVSSEMRVQVADGQAYFYPDLVGFCGEAQLADEHLDTLTNPTFIAEVLSPSTEAFDRGEKFARYRTIPTLVDYLLIAQDRMRVERFSRQEGDGWLLSVHTEGTVVLPSLRCELEVAEMYRRTLATERATH